MKAVKSIRNAKFGSVDTAPLPTATVPNNTNYDPAVVNLAWGLAKDIICTTARDIVNKLPLLPKLRRVQYERRWTALVDLLKSRQAQPGFYAIALLTLQRDIDAQLAEAKRYVANNRPRLARMVVEWEKAYDAATGGCLSPKETPLKHVQFDVETEKEEPTLL